MEQYLSLIHIFWCAGVDLGAYQAVNCRLRRPNLFAGAVGMGGIYDLSRFWGAENDDLVLRCSPLPVSYTHLASGPAEWARGGWRRS